MSMLLMLDDTCSVPGRIETEKRKTDTQMQVKRCSEKNIKDCTNREQGNVEKEKPHLIFKCYLFRGKYITCPIPMDKD